MQKDERDIVVENFQNVLQDVRRQIGWNITQMANVLDVTRQTISNLETKRTKLTWVQYLAFAAVIDHDREAVKKHDALEFLIDQSEGSKEACISSFKHGSMLERWFDDSEGDSQGLSQQDVLDELVANYKIFLDTSIFLADGAEEFFERLSDSLQEHGVRAILPERVVAEFQGLESQGRRRAEHILRCLRAQGVLSIRGDSMDPDNAHDTILSVVFRFRSRYQICLMTQDAAFAERLLYLAGTGNPDGILAFGLVQGRLRAWKNILGDVEGENDEHVGGWSFPAGGLKEQDTEQADRWDALDEDDEWERLGKLQGNEEDDDES